MAPWGRRVGSALCLRGITSRSAHAASAATWSHAVVYHPDFRINPIPDAHRFPMPKDHLLFERLSACGLATRTFTPAAPDRDTLCLVHDEAYVDAFIDGTLPERQMRRIGLPWSEQLVRRTLVGVGSAVLAARLALQFGVACMCNGGTHHAHRSHGSGWCVFNDLAVAARSVQRDAGVARVMFVDLDVHQGDGTASIFAADPSVFTLSLHCEAQSFPEVLHRSDVDVPLPAGCTDEQYIAALTHTLPAALEAFRPGLVLYNSGVDVHGEDALGKMALTDAGILRRDRFVFAICAELGVPVAAAIGGGYSPQHERIVDRHMLLHQAASEHADRLLRATRLGKQGRGGKQLGDKALAPDP